MKLVKFLSVIESYITAFILIMTMQIGLWWQGFVRNQDWELITVMTIILSGPACLILWILRVTFERFK